MLIFKNRFLIMEYIIHQDIFTKVRAEMPQEEKLYELADFFKVFGDSTRIKILYALFASDMCVQDLAEVLDMNQSAISHQLRVLKQAGLVKYHKDGKYAIYSLDDEHVTQIIGQGMTHISERSLSKECKKYVFALFQNGRGRNPALSHIAYWLRRGSVPTC